MGFGGMLSMEQSENSIELDHLAVSGETLEEAVAHVEDALGVSMRAGGVHPHFGTHNRLLGLGDGLYLEAIAKDPSVGTLEHPRWFDLDRFQGHPRLGNWICRVADLEAAVSSLPSSVGRPVALSRGDLRWRMAVPDDGILPCDGCFPALIEWQSRDTPGAMLSASGCRLVRLEVAHPEANWIAKTLGFSDPRVIYVTGPRALRATFDTPHGPRVLE